MKDLTKKKFAIGALSVAIIGCLGFSVYTSMHLNDGQDKEKKQNTTQVQKENQKESIKDNSKEEKKEIHLNPLNGKEDPELSKDKKVMTRYEVVNTETKIRDMYRKFQFEKGIEELNKLAENNSFLDDAEILGNLQFDGTLMANLFDDNEINGTAIINLFTAFKDPEDLLLAVLNTDKSIKPYIILYQGSLSPTFVDGTYPTILKKSTEALPYQVSIIYPETKKYHKIQFSLEGFILNAYILEYEDGSLHFYMIEDPEDKSNYYSIEQWKKIDENISKGLPAMEGVLELKDSAPSPNEQRIDDVEKKKSSDTNGNTEKIKETENK